MVAHTSSPSPSLLRRPCAGPSARRQISTRYVVRESLNWLVVTSALRRRPAPGTIRILDQGMFQAIWSIGLGARESVIARFDPSLALAMPIPDVVVVVEADLAAVIGRLQRRSGSGSRVDAWSPDDGHALPLPSFPLRHRNLTPFIHGWSSVAAYDGAAHASVAQLDRAPDF